MSDSPDCCETGRRVMMRSQEKSNFAQTCSLLSQYLKEKGSFGDLSLGMTCNSEGNQEATTRNFLQKVGEISYGESEPFSSNMKAMNLFPQQAGFGPSDSLQVVPKKADFSAKMASGALPTDDILCRKSACFRQPSSANEVMLLASKASSVNNQRNISGFLSATGGNSTQEPPQRPSQPIASYLPIARKASLQRFLEKRKDRIGTKAPYQVDNSVLAQAKLKPLERTKSWLDIAAQARNLSELQL